MSHFLQLFVRCVKSSSSLPQLADVLFRFLVAVVERNSTHLPHASMKHVDNGRNISVTSEWDVFRVGLKQCAVEVSVYLIMLINPNPGDCHMLLDFFF